ncbi:MAG: hypothetical protein AAB865_02120 [Patescibacteria group bacterium]
MIDLRPLFRPAFWFNANPAPLSTAGERTLFIVFAVFLVLGAIIRMVATHRSEDRHVTEVFSRIGRLGVTMGLLGLLAFFFMFENVPLLGARFWLLVWGVGLIVWIVTIVRYIVKVVPAERAEELARQEREKYLPKAKS